MGAYLNKPNKDKVSEDDSLGKLKYGASSMQGWRISQEDAHNCCLDFDKDTSLFAVYDGHGGAEVAEYAAAKLPDFIKDIPTYKDGKIAEALEEAFLKFDATLVKEDVIETLREMAGVNIDEDDEDEEEAEKLHEEADMPMEELMKRYGYVKRDEQGEECEDKNIGALRKKRAVLSPAIKSKSTSAVGDGDGEGDIKVKLDDQLVNGHSGKTASAPAPDSTESSEVKTSDITNGSPSSKVDSSQTVPDTCSSSDGGTAADGVSVDHSQDSGVSSSTPGASIDCAGEGSASSGSSALNSQPSGEPSSSSGRTRVKKTGIIPKEGEDESSFDEDEEDTEEEEGSDEEAEPWKSGSDDEEDSEDDSLGAFVEEDEDEEEEDEEIMTGGEEPGRDSGCTAVVAVLHKDQLYVANAGDSRCVLCRNGKAIDLSVDHKPEDEVERKRIENAGGRITKDGRVNGGLNLSRAIGDHCYKQNPNVSDKEQMITALPDIRTATLTDEDEFMVLACDGIWNVMSSQDVVTFIKERLDSGVEKLSSICEEMFDLCLAPDTSGDGTGCDNMTCIIVTFGDHFPDLRKSSDSEAKPAGSVGHSESASDAQTSIDVAQSAAVHSTDDKQVDSMSASGDCNPNTTDNAAKRKADDKSLDCSSTKKSRTEEET